MFSIVEPANYLSDGGCDRQRRQRSRPPAGCGWRQQRHPQALANGIGRRHMGSASTRYMECERKARRWRARRTEHDERRKGGGRDRQRKGGGPTCATHRRISHQQTPPPDRASVVVAGSRVCRSCSLSALTKSEGAPTLPDAEADGGRGRGWSIYGGEVEETGQVAAGVNQQEGIERGGPGGQP
jgi:hypothetical protein